ncbi:MAG: Rab family GTPase [Promethearchaeota archaeon]
MPVYKICVVGDGGVGKSSLLETKVSKNFDPSKQITIGVDFKLIPLKTDQDDGEKSNFLAMDLGGQDRFQFIHDSYIKGIKAALILFDVSRIRTFFNIKKWYDLIMQENDKTPVLIVANKSDLLSPEKREDLEYNMEELIKELPNNKNIYGHYFTSSKDYKGIEEVFAICEEMILTNINSNSERITCPIALVS